MAKKSPVLVDIGQGLSLMVGLPTIAFWDIGSRPQKPQKGTFGFNFETNSLEYWDGTKWLSAPMTEM